MGKKRKKRNRRKLPVLTYQEHKKLFDEMSDVQLKALADFKKYEMESWFYTYSFLEETNWVFSDIKVDPWYDRHSRHSGENLYCDCGRRVKYLYILESKKIHNGKRLVKKLGITHFELEAGIPLQIIQEIRKGVNRIDRYQDSILIAYRHGKRFDDNLFEETVNAGAFKENRHQILYEKCLAFRQADLPLFVDDENHLQKVYQEAMAALDRKQREQKRKEWELQHPKKQKEEIRQNRMLKRIRRASMKKWRALYGKKIHEEYMAIVSEQVYKSEEYLELLNRLKKRKESVNDIIEYRWQMSQKRLSKIFKSEGWQLIDIDVGDKGYHLVKTACICGQLYPWGVILQRDGKIICFNVHHLAKHHVLSEEKAKIVERCFKQMQRDLFEVCEHTLEHPDYWSKKFTKVINDQNYMRRDTPQYQYLSFLRAHRFAAPNAFNKRFIEQYKKKLEGKRKHRAKQLLEK